MIGAGTPEYGAPEVMEEGKRGNPAADMWAVGMMLLRACMGHSNLHVPVILMHGKVQSDFCGIYLLLASTSVNQSCDLFLLIFDFKLYFIE